MRVSPTAKLLLGLAISAVCLFLVFRNLSLRDIWQGVLTARPRYLLLAVVLNLATIVVRTLRWRRLFGTERSPKPANLFAATAIGFMANNVLPARAGELVRAHVIARRESLGMSTAIATIVVARMFDMVALVMLMAVALLAPGLPGAAAGEATAEGVFRLDTLRAAGALAAVAAVGGMAFLSVLRAWPALAVRVVSTLLHPFPAKLVDKVRDLLTTFAAGLHGLRSWSTVGGILGWSLLVWLTASGTVLCVLLAFDLSLPVTAPLLLVSLTSFAAAFPSSPGYVGPFHYACYAGLTAYGVAPVDGGMVALVVHACMIVPVTLLGITLAGASGVSLSAAKDVE